MLCAPTASVLRDKVATPALFRVPVPIAVPLFLKVTVPVGVPVAGATGATVAVNVTDWPDTLGLGELVSAVVEAVEAPWFTVWVSALDVDVTKFPSPP